METKRPAPIDIDAYIAGFPADVQEKLEKIRQTIRATVPYTEETISYNIPAFTVHGAYLIYFAGFKNHISLYPAPIGNEEFREELSAYQSGKGTAKFQLDRPIPFDLIRKIVRFREKEALKRVEKRKSRR